MAISDHLIGHKENGLPEIIMKCERIFQDKYEEVACYEAHIQKQHNADASSVGYACFHHADGIW